MSTWYLTLRIWLGCNTVFTWLKGMAIACGTCCCIVVGYTRFTGSAVCNTSSSHLLVYYNTCIKNGCTIHRTCLASANSDSA